MNAAVIKSMCLKAALETRTASDTPAAIIDRAKLYEAYVAGGDQPAHEIPETQRPRDKRGK